MQNECRLSIITVNYNGVADTCSLIDSIPYTQDMEIIVVDNASSGNDAVIIKQRYPHVIVIESQENLGFAGGNNLGIQASHGQYLFFINNDTEFRGVWMVDALINRIETDDTIGMVCPKIRFSWSNSPIQFAGYTPLTAITLRNRSIGYNEDDHGQYDTPHPTAYAHGAAMLASRKAIERVGIMPECYFLYYEELDWSEMFTRKGYQIWYEPSCTIYHKESQSTGQSSPLRTYYISRNRLIFANRNMPKVKSILSSCYLIMVVAMRDIILHLVHRRCDLATATCQGIWDFLRGKTGKK